MIAFETVPEITHGHSLQVSKRNTIPDILNSIREGSDSLIQRSTPNSQLDELQDLQELLKSGASKVTNAFDFLNLMSQVNPLLDNLISTEISNQEADIVNLKEIVTSLYDTKDRH